MQEIRELIGVCESRDPTDVDRMHLKKLVKELVRRNEILTSEVRELNKVVEQLKEGRYNEMEAGKHLSQDELSRLQRQLKEAERAKEEALRES
jgi:dynactin complex subunit